MFNPKATHIKGQIHNQPMKQFHYKYPYDTDDPLTSPLNAMMQILIPDIQLCYQTTSIAVDLGDVGIMQNEMPFVCPFFRWTIRSSIEHMKFQTHPRVALRNWQSRSTYKVHARLSAMRMKWLCNSCLQMMSLNEAPNVPVHQPEDSPWKNIYTTTEPVSLIRKRPNSEEHRRTGKEFRWT